MRRKRTTPVILFFVVLLLALPLATPVSAADRKPLVYDKAGLLTQEEVNELNALANEYGAHRETDIMIMTIDSPEAYGAKEMAQDFYDAYGPGFDKPHGNTAILMLDMANRDLYIAAFYKAKEYLDDDRLDKIRDKITSDLSDGNYKQAFQTYIEKVDYYMGFSPEVNPDNLLYNIWVQLGVSVVIGGGIVTLMVRRSGGRITVNSRTYENAGTSGVLAHEDRYLHTSVSRRKIESSSSSSDGGGGGTTSGGHSHSGSRGSF